MSHLTFRVRITNLGTLPIIASVSLTHIPCLFACFHESVSCVYAFLSTCLSTCVALAACFVLGSVLSTALWFSFFFSHQIYRHLCQHIDVRTTLLLCLSSFIHLHLHFSNSCVCVFKHVYAFSSFCIFMHIYRHIHMYVLCSVLYL